MYEIPADDRPRYVDWEAQLADGAPAELQWWLPANVHHGGRDATAVIDSKGQMAVFHGREQVGTAAAPYAPHVPHGEDFWPLMLAADADMGDGTPAAMSHRLRDTGWMMCRVDDELGLAPAVPSDGSAPMLWRLAQAFVLLGFYPPLGISFQGKPGEFATGVSTIGERSARRVKRAMIDRANADRKNARALSDRIQANWRLS